MTAALLKKTDYTIVWVKSVSDTELYESGEKIIYVIHYCQMFCSDKELRILERFMFPVNRLKSPIKVPTGNDEYDINSGSVSEALYNKICKKWLGII